MSIEGSSSATLGNTPLLHLLVSMADRQMSGTLTFQTPEHSKGAVVFVGGVPRKIAADAPHCRLGDLLVEYGWLDAYSAETTYATALEQKALHGTVLVEHRLVDALGLTHVLYHQLIRKLTWVARSPASTALGLHEGVDRLAKVPRGPEPSSPLAIVWTIAKSHVDEANKRAVLMRATDRPLQLHARSDPKAFGFDELEMALIDRLRHVRLDLTTLLYQLELPRQTAEALLYVLLLTRHIDIGDGRMPVGAALSSSVPPPNGSGEYSALGRVAVARQSQAPGENDGLARRMNRTLGAEALLRAEHLLKGDRLQLAEVEAKRALEFEPENPRCMALHAWILAQLPGSADTLEQVLESLTAALDLDPIDVRTRFFRSEILKRLDRLEEAVAEWQLILELDPHHIDVQRELRLWEMRRASGHPAPRSASGTHRQVSLTPAAAGFFGKLFKGSR